MNEEEAGDVLDYALFGNVHNMRYDENKYLITYEGNFYVVVDRASGDKHHFEVAITPRLWDSEQALEHQEWYEDES